MSEYNGMPSYAAYLATLTSCKDEVFAELTRLDGVLHESPNEYLSDREIAQTKEAIKYLEKFL